MNQITNDIIQLILSYMIPQQYVLVDGIDQTRIFNIAQQFIPEKDPEEPEYRVYYNKENQMLYMEKDNRMVQCTDFTITSITVVLVEDKWEKCIPDHEAMQYMLSFQENCDEDRLCINKHPVIVNYLITHPDKIKWKFFSMNSHPNAVNYLLQHIDCIIWVYFNQNHSIEAVEYLIDHPERIEWFTFSQNPYIYKKVDDIVTQIEWFIEITQGT